MLCHRDLLFLPSKGWSAIVVWDGSISHTWIATRFVKYPIRLFKDFGKWKKTRIFETNRVSRRTLSPNERSIEMQTRVRLLKKRSLSWEFGFGLLVWKDGKQMNLSRSRKRSLVEIGVRSLRAKKSGWLVVTLSRMKFPLVVEKQNSVKLNNH